MYSEEQCARRWTELLAPRTGDVGEELTIELSEYLGVPIQEVQAQLVDATERFTEEWRRSVPDGADEGAVTRFYNESKTELFDLARWHSHDAIHYRTLMCADIAAARPGRDYLDYGSGIGSDALVFASCGFNVTLADISNPLLEFARWRCWRRGFDVQAIDLKKESLPHGYDAVICLDVLEHIHRPLRTLNAIHRSMRPGALLFMHAPFGYDEDRPMHVVHEDIVTPRMRTVGFNWRNDLEACFPKWLWHPKVYESFELSPIDRVGYQLYDVWLKGPVGDGLARLYRRVKPNRRRASRAAGI